ncbi:hypothetical protein Hanom_Chr04g00359761 [Helianthus anomalus]
MMLSIMATLLAILLFVWCSELILYGLYFFSVFRWFSKQGAACLEDKVQGL